MKDNNIYDIINISKPDVIAIFKFIHFIYIMFLYRTKTVSFLRNKHKKHTENCNIICET